MSLLIYAIFLSPLLNNSITIRVGKDETYKEEKE